MINPAVDVYSHLPLPTKRYISCSQVCTAFKQLAYDGSLWSRIDLSTHYRSIPCTAVVKFVGHAGSFLREVNFRCAVRLRVHSPAKNTLAVLLEQFRSIGRPKYPSR